VFRRPPRQPGPALPRGEIVLEAPVELPEPAGGGLGQVLMYLPMLAGGGAMTLMFVGAGGTVVTYLAGGLYGVSMMGMGLSQVGRGSGDRRRRLNGARRDYLRYLAQARRRARTAARAQREHLLWHHPAPDALWSVVSSPRLWERRLPDADFGNVRVGTGAQQLAVRLLPPEAKPVEDLEPMTAGALRRFLQVHSRVPDLPVAVSLRTCTQLTLLGNGSDTRSLTRAILAELATLHSPEDARVAVCASAERAAEWDWVKWLPHALHLSAADGAGPVRMVTDDLAELERMLGPDLADRPRFSPEAAAGTDVPHLVVVLDGGAVPPDSLLAAADTLGVTVIDVAGALGRAGEPGTVRLRVAPGQLASVHKDPTGEDTEARIGVPDRLGLTQAAALARQLAPLRLSYGADTDEPLRREFSLAALLGVTDVAELDPDTAWRPRPARDRLRVPIGVSTDGTPVELDIKESAQNGMGPHGLIVGATGSGKSELLRTLVLALAMTHSSEQLNVVLVDFKGGATFLGLDELPHVSALITNLADELPLVDRMHDALHGELVRRQELLRRAGNFTSVYDYERARAQGAPLDPLPTLLVVVDEFSELLASKPEFADLFVMIGRLGRSLAIHLLLASQRLDEGRLRGLETHLSYRICLRTFAASESRLVIGVPYAYELPTEPGHGYLRVDVSTLIRFRAAYVSGVYRPRRRRAPLPSALGSGQVLPYRAGFVAPPVPASPPDLLDAEPAEAPEDEISGGGRPGDNRVLDVVVRQLHGRGRPAHQVWLPPLDAAITLDALLPPLTTDPDRGLHAVGASGLVVPVGVVDRPFDQRRDPLLADLSGGSGHVAIVGRPRSGKSTLLRTLITALALTNTPDQVHFYCLDLGGGALGALGGMPHVGGVATRLRAEQVRRTLAEVGAILEARERDFADLGVESMAEYRAARPAPSGQARAAGSPSRYGGDAHADIFLVVDGWQVLRTEFDAQEQAAMDLAARGLAYGVHLILTANRWAELRPQVRDLMGTRFELRLGEPFESDVDRRAAANVPPDRPGRGITAERLHFLAGLPRVDGDADPESLSAGLSGLVDSVRTAWTGPVAPPVRLLPTRLSLAELRAAAAPEGRGIPIGLTEETLTGAYLDLEAEPHAVVIGDPESGKSNLLRLVIGQLTDRYPRTQARFIVVDYRRSLLGAVPEPYLIGYASAPSTADSLMQQAAEALQARLPGPDVTAQQLAERSWWTGADLFVIVDDYQLVATATGNPLGHIAELLPHGADIGLHLILARSAGGVSRALFEPVLQRLRDLGVPGVLLSGGRDEGAVWADVVPQRLPAGRGILASRRSAGRQLIQTALADAAETSG
jgi:S-DNA-T family DNA segregation ATPase FtsK/SpoIIIE